MNVSGACAGCRRDGTQRKTMDKDKKQHYQRAEKVIHHAFESAKISVKIFSEETGDSSRLTDLLLEKTSLEHQIARQFALIGSRVYKNLQQEGRKSQKADVDIERLMIEAQRLELELARVEAALEEERRERKSGHKVV